ncbi:putative anti-sigma-YlaC factor YlaD [Allocatelliglobosispora scoriae]|uniref:Putative anti-sigma-YlaC factor YlaD n=1 Tax=Allocatelliglobosispora scoriae TaxID=643052 RepID=A0A841C5I1_9ACTN|nr:zf-HC2 domain-containing protein [Allocatelliglobosispora scoriae]MBB5874383.1 putative anti-sigma-YlaC factor YlaD [Allocatelliglobosispora scoriae]
MRCEQIRDALSARLDGEDDPDERAAVDGHLADCAECTAWLAAATDVTRLARVGLPEVPELPPERLAALLAAAPGAGRARVALGLRWALGVVGLVQFLLGVVQITALDAGLTGHAHTDPTGGVASGHLWHESAAWNVAIGAGFAWVAWRRSRPAGLLPILSVFVGVLALLTINDSLSGRVDLSRILSHGFILAGYLLLIALGRPRFAGMDPPAGSGRSGWRLRLTEEPDGPLATVHPFPVRAATRGEVVAEHRRAA